MALNGLFWSKSFCLAENMHKSLWISPEYMEYPVLSAKVQNSFNPCQPCKKLSSFECDGDSNTGYRKNYFYRAM